MKNLFRAVAVAASLASASVSPAATTIDFDALANNTSVDNSYAGVTFTNFLAITFTTPNTSGPNIAFVFGNQGTIDFSTAVTSLSFMRGFFNPGTVNVFSGNGGTGTLLGSTALAANDPNSSWEFTALSFTGAAKSFVFTTATENTLGIDDLTFSSAAVPEPQSWMLLITGFGLVGAAARRRRSVITA